MKRALKLFEDVAPLLIIAGLLAVTSNAYAVTQYETSGFDTSQDCATCMSYKSSDASGFQSFGGITLPVASSIEGFEVSVVLDGTANVDVEIWSRNPDSGEPDALIDSVAATVSASVPGSVDVNGDAFLTPVSRVTLSMTRGTKVLPAGPYYFSVVGTDGNLRLSTVPGALWYREAGMNTNLQLAFGVEGEVPVRVDGTAYTASGLNRDLYEANASGNSPGQMFAPDSYFNNRNDWRPVKSDSADRITYLMDKYPSSFLGYALGKSAFHGNGTDELFVSHVMTTDNATENLVDWTPDQTNFFTPDCDYLLSPSPALGRTDNALGRTGRTQNNAGYDNLDGGDSHLYAWNQDTFILSEFFKSDGIDNATKATRFSGCARKYDTSKKFDNYEDLGCTSANAAGLAYSPFLVTPEFKAGDHMIAFTLPNAYTERNSIHRPGTHNPLQEANGWLPAEAGPGTPFCYGCILILRDDWTPTGSIGTIDQAIVDTLKTHGMQHIDGSSPGQIILSNDYLADQGWNAANGGSMAPFALSTAGLLFSDFHVVEPFGTNDAETQFIYSSKPTCSRTQVREFNP